MTRIPCDSSSLISLSDNCVLRLLEGLGHKFVIPKRIKMEVFDNPLSTKRFKLKALQINSYIKKGVIEVIEDPFIYDYAQKITDLANSLLSYHGSNVKIIHQGEAEVIACLKVLKENTILLDERTTRHLIEDPDQLKKYMQSRTNLILEMDEQVKKALAKELSNVNVIRSAEVFAYAYEKGLMPQYGKEALEGGLYALKFSGCSITDDEIKDYVELLK
jgi:predicted nucleic acid-binding protein